MRVHLTLKSGNAKTGPMPVSTSEAKTCPSTCAFYGQRPDPGTIDSKSKCYASGGPLYMHWRTIAEKGLPWDAFCAAIARMPAGQVWRHNQAGDLPGEGHIVNAKLLAGLVKANQGKRGFTYTHKPVTGKGAHVARNRKAIAKANAAGFTVNLSADTLAQADELSSLGIGPVVCVVPSDAPDKLTTPEGRTAIVCPAQRVEDMNCLKCQLCSVGSRKAIVAFRAHGAKTKQIDAALASVGV
jgi:hypothetical protein